MNSVRCSRLALMLFMAGSTLAAQNAGAPPELTTIRKNVDEVNLTLTVTDGKGHFVEGLKPENFEILDDRRPPVTVNRFLSLTELPLDLCIVIDASDSVSPHVKFQQEVAVGFLRRILRPGMDRACLIRFASTPVLVQDFTDDLKKLEAKVRAMSSEGTTAIWDALRFASETMARESSTGERRRALVLLTDGEDNSSAIALEDAVQSVLHAEITVESVNTGYKEDCIPRLRRLARETGGKLWEGDSPKRLAASLAKLEKSLRSGYFVAYQPAGELAPGRFRKIQVKARGLKGKVAHRSGYFVPSS